MCAAKGALSATTIANDVCGRWKEDPNWAPVPPIDETEQTAPAQSSEYEAPKETVSSNRSRASRARQLHFCVGARR